MSTPGDGTDGRSGWCGRGAHHRCIGAYDVVCGCTCHATASPVLDPSTEEIAAMSTTSFWTEAALQAWLVDAEYEPAEFDMPAMLARLNDGTDVSWFDLIHDHHVARQTAVSCPAYCELDQFHLFGAADGPDEPQSREHVIDLTPTDVVPAEDYLETLSVSVLVPELRQGNDDSTATLAFPHLWMNIEGSFTADDARKIAAALLTAADKMREMEP